jgi:hypothetical protein
MVFAIQKTDYCKKGKERKEKRKRRRKKEKGKRKREKRKEKGERGRENSLKTTPKNEGLIT